jgi:signal transduction histidine kinase
MTHLRAPFKDSILLFTAQFEERLLRMSMNEEAQEAAGAEQEPAATPVTSAAEECRASHLGFVAHEIRNPLSTALWTAELLGRMDGGERAGARGEKLAGMCLRSLQRVRHLIEDHLLNERLDGGAYPIRPESVSLVDAVVAAEGRRAGGDKPIELTVAAELSVLADRTLLGRLLDTLLDAASQGASTARVSAGALDGEVMLTVRGAAAEARALEDPLKGASSDTRGRALALPAARRTAARMGGRLDVRDGAWELTLPEAHAD